MDDRRSTIEHRLRAAHGRVVAALVRRFGVDRLAMAEDGLQEASLRAVEAGARLEGNGELERWLVRVAGNWIIDQLRRERVGAPIRALPEASAETIAILGAGRIMP